MDWFLDRSDRRAASDLRRQLAAYLRRHAADPSQVDDAELAVEELVGNAIRHSDGPVWVSVEWGGLQPQLSVYDLGEDFDLDTELPDDGLSERGRGLFLAAHLTTQLRKAHRRAGGNKVTTTLLVERAAESDFSPARRTSGALPALNEAGDEGAFGKEAFLRALVVQLSHVLEEQQGPAATEAAVAQVGTDVGGQMEAAYRAARGVSGRLSPEQMGDCYVRLKHAIEGDFSVVEANDERIVLLNRRCPFGDAVQRSPSLCRMTSSVFGGIAARNAGGATVLLEERIAVGDPGCRVVVELGPRQTAAPAGHRYPRPADAVDP